MFTDWRLVIYIIINITISVFVCLLGFRGVLLEVNRIFYNLLLSCVAFANGIIMWTGGGMVYLTDWGVRQYRFPPV